MPTAKKAKRKSARERPTQKGRAGMHPLGKLFYVVLACACIGLVAILVTRWSKDHQPIPPKGRPIANNLELQVALAREGFSPGSIDGHNGGQTTLALSAYQTANDLAPTGVLDEATTQQLLIEDPVYVRIELKASDFDKVAPKPNSWIERGQLDAMLYNSILEMVAEYAQSDPDTVVQLNPTTTWASLKAGDQILVPYVPAVQIKAPIAYVRIQLSNRTLQAFDSEGRLHFHCPVSIARRIDKRPSGQLAVKVLVENPNYTFNPNILTATAEREGITQKFIIQPGPNNPVGSTWIGLSLPTYGIHGTPEPEKVGRTESSGCFRLANWNAQALLKAAWVGMPILVDP